jgi:biopolymer transport protein ExbD
MPSVKIPKKSTDFDMTPFVDVAFLILSFFMLATKFKPPEAVKVTTPSSVSSSKLKEDDALLIEMDKEGRVFFTLNLKNADDNGLKQNLIKNLNTTRNLGLTPNEINNFVNYTTVGVPFAKLKGLLSLPKDQRVTVKQEGIPVQDSTNNELEFWVRDAITVMAGRPVLIMIKGDNDAKYPSFKGVIDALKKNEQLKYRLITDPEAAPAGTEFYKMRQKGKTEQDI